MIGDRKIILIISDDEEDRLLGQQSYLRGKRVLTSRCENGWDAVCKHASRLYAVFMDMRTMRRVLQSPCWPSGSEFII